jgi:hypothetical protein
MSPYNERSSSNQPNPNPEQPGAYPPPPTYSYPSYDYNEGYYYPRRQPSSSGTDSRRLWRVIGLIALLWFIGAVLIGHHGLVLFVLLVGAFFFLRGRPYYSSSWRSWRYYHPRAYYRHTRPFHRNYYYPPASQPPSYYPSPSQQPGSAGWPIPTPPNQSGQEQLH